MLISGLTRDLTSPSAGVGHELQAGLVSGGDHVRSGGGPGRAGVLGRRPAPCCGQYADGGKLKHRGRVWPEPFLAAVYLQYTGQAFDTQRDKHTRQCHKTELQSFP